MKFLVRQVSKTADGREIIRTAAHDTDAVTIGCAPVTKAPVIAFKVSGPVATSYILELVKT